MWWCWLCPWGLIETILQHILKPFWLSDSVSQRVITRYRPKKQSNNMKKQKQKTAKVFSVLSPVWQNTGDTTWQNIVDSVKLTETFVVGKVSQEVVTLFSLTPAGWAGAPWSHVGSGVVDVVGRYCTSWRETAHRPQSVLNIHLPFDLLHCIHSALLSETLMDNAFPINWPDTRGWLCSVSLVRLAVCFLQALEFFFSLI